MAPKRNGNAGNAKKAAPVVPKSKAGCPQSTANSEDPAAERENDIPSLKDATITFTGELDGMTRDDIVDKVKAAGAKVMSSVSGNTTFLVVGTHLDDGRPVEDTSKYKKYLELKAKAKKCPMLLDEAKLMSMLGSNVPPPRPVVIPPRSSAATSSVASKEHWVDRHAPKRFEDLLGNAGAIKKLVEWLRDWDDVVLRGRTKAPRFKPGGGMPDNINARAALVSGPPGIGKTTACRLLVRAHGGYELQEYNASDARSQKIIQKMADGLSNNRTLAFGSGATSALGSSTTPAVTRRTVIIMDEVDGMGGGDRGGNAALIKMIKKTKNPIICICNDHGSPKVRSLAFSCYDIRFSRPSKTTVAQRASDIAAAEGLSAEPNAMEALAESCGNDVRHMLNQLQLMATSSEYRKSGVGYTDMKQHIREIEKDAVSMLSPFDACKNLLTTSISQRMSIRERLDNFFVDHSLVHLLIQENYLNAVSKKPLDSELLCKCADSAELFALGDVLSQRIRDNQEWNLLPDMGMLSAILPAYSSNGFIAFPEFPKFLGNYSKGSRARRLSSELHTFLRMSTTTSRTQLVRSDYLTLLYSRALRPLQKEDVDGAVAVLDAYGLQREHLVEHLSELQQHLKLGGEDEFKLIDAKVKAAMTRELNRGGHAVRVVLPGGKKRKVPAPEADDLGEEDDIDGSAEKKQKVDEEGGNEDPEKAEAEEPVVLGGLLKQKSAKSSAKAKAKSAGRSSKVDDVEEDKSKRNAKSSSAIPKNGKASVPPKSSSVSAVAKTTVKAKAAAKEVAVAKTKAKSKASVASNVKARGGRS